MIVTLRHYHFMRKERNAALRPRCVPMALWLKKMFGLQHVHKFVVEILSSWTPANDNTYLFASQRFK